MPDQQLPLDEAQSLYAAARVLDRVLDRMRQSPGGMPEFQPAAYLSISNQALALRNIAAMIECGRL